MFDERHRRWIWQSNLKSLDINGVSKTTEAIDAWVDTGFTGDLVVPHSIIESLGLKSSGAIDGVLADGTQTLLETYH
jgi:predicted aspartyl protease